MVDKYTPWAIDSVGETDVNGPKVETDATFTEAKIRKGSTAERFPYPTFNRLMNRADVSINDLLNNTPPSVSSRENAISLGIYSEEDCFADGASELNQVLISGATLRTIWPTKIEGVPKILAVNMTSGNASIIIVDPETMEVEATQDLSGGLAAGTWTIQGVVADGTNAYVCFQKSTNEQYVQAYDMATWAVADGWPATGTQYSTGSTLAMVQIIHADAVSLAIASNNASIGTREMITLVSKADGTITDTGNGDSTATGTQALKDLASNGTNLFFYISGKLCSAFIADLSTGGGGTAWPLTTTYGGRTFAAGEVVYSAGAGGLTVVHQDCAYGFTYVTADNRVIDEPLRMGYDGINWWCLCDYDPADAGNHRPGLTRLYLEKSTRGQDALTSRTDLEKFCRTYNLGAWTLASLGPISSDVPLNHDGRDFWFSDGSTIIHRFPLTHWR